LYAASRKLASGDKIDVSVQESLLEGTDWTAHFVPVQTVSMPILISEVASDGMELWNFAKALGTFYLLGSPCSGQLYRSD
jgi:hypothetical protein